MKVFVAGSCPIAVNRFAPIMTEDFRALAACDSIRLHSVVGSPGEADIILFVDNHMNPDWRVCFPLEHPLFKEYPSKCMVYDERDRPWLCPLPGVYVSMPARYFDAGSQRAWAYYTLSGKTTVPPGMKPDLLYSFMGTPGPRSSGGHGPRRAILSLRDDRTILEDTSGFVFYDDHGDPVAHAARQRRFAETIGRSKFVLCPRGAGTSSFRMYEVMRAGRVPVIIADQWAAPAGPDWQRFSLRVGHHAVDQIPKLLRKREEDWPAMAAEAAAAYRKWFAPDVNFHNIIEGCCSIMDAGHHTDSKLRARRDRRLRRRHVVVAVRSHVGRALRSLGFRK